MPIINPASGEILFHFHCPGRAVTLDISADGTVAIIGGDMGANTKNGFIATFDVATGSLITKVQLEYFPYKIVIGSNEQIVSLCADGQIIILQLKNLKVSRRCFA